MAANLTPQFRLEQLVRKVGGDYSYEGDVRSIVIKRSGQLRYVVEDDRGCLHIFSGSQLEARDD